MLSFGRVIQSGSILLHDLRFAMDSREHFGYMDAHRSFVVDTISEDYIVLSASFPLLLRGKETAQFCSKHEQHCSREFDLWLSVRSTSSPIFRDASDSMDQSVQFLPNVSSDSAFGTGHNATVN